MPASGGALHRKAGAAQPSTHEPPLHTRFDAHALPHMPQLLRSVITSLQPVAQSCWVPAHAATQLPSLQTLPPEQAIPREPQFFESTFRSTHFPLQSVQGTGGLPTRRQ